MNISAYCSTKLIRNLPRRIAGDEVAANDVASLRAVHNQNAIQVATNPVLLDYVIVTCAYQSDAEIIAGAAREL